MKEEQVCPNVSVKEEQVKNQKQKENVVVEDGFKILVKDLDGRTHTLIIGADNTIGDLKILIEKKTNTSPVRQRLICNGRQLEDGRTLNDYNVKVGSTIHLVLGLRGC